MLVKKAARSSFHIRVNMCSICTKLVKQGEGKPILCTTILIYRKRGEKQKSHASEQNNTHIHEAKFNQSTQIKNIFLTFCQHLLYEVAFVGIDKNKQFYTRGCCKCPTSLFELAPSKHFWT